MDKQQAHTILKQLSNRVDSTYSPEQEGIDPCNLTRAIYAQVEESKTTFARIQDLHEKADKIFDDLMKQVKYYRQDNSAENRNQLEEISNNFKSILNEIRILLEEDNLVKFSQDLSEGR